MPRLPSTAVTELQAITRTYASVWFCDSPWVGAWFALVTLAFPRAALCGLAGLLLARLWGRLLGIAGEGHWVNGLLCGLFIGAMHDTGLRQAGLVAGASLLVTLGTAWLASSLWRAGKLPVLSLPFALVIAMMLLALGPYGLGAAPFPHLAVDTSAVFPRDMERFFTAVGWLLLVPYPWTGALIFAGLLVASRYLALLAVAGYVAGECMLTLLGHAGNSNTAFNPMLAAVAVGGILTVPGVASFCTALVAGVLAVWFGLVFAPAFHLFQLPLTTLPFVAAVFLCVGALASRAKAGAPWLMLDQPTMPERAYERVRLAEVRGAPANSVPLFAPFYGEWTVTQGFNGPHTHQAPWQHALDFEITEDGCNHRGSQTSCADYYCFGVPVLAPAAGQVVRLRNDLADMPPGKVDLAHNWGNHLLIRMADGNHVLLAHLRQGSISVTVGAWVVAGQPVAQCGSSGRSPVPHLHMHVQAGTELGSPTLPFHLTNIVERREQGAREFKLSAAPAAGVCVALAPVDERLASALRLPIGQPHSYYLESDGASRACVFKAELTLLGQQRIAVTGGRGAAVSVASAAFQDTSAVVGYYDRAGGGCLALDMWLLALGLTPLSTAANRWRDRPSLSLLPLRAHERLLVALLRPLGGGCNSHYERCWDQATQSWLQKGVHELRLLPGLVWRARTQAWIAPGLGVLRIRLQVRHGQWELVQGRQALRLIEGNHDAAQGRQDENDRNNNAGSRIDAGGRSHATGALGR
jgi:murein DD-endopeptidase MepM/ murein hydrolase activator NlpD